MTDRISRIAEQARVILEWCRQQRLPEEQRDIFEFRYRSKKKKNEWEWEKHHPSHPDPNFKVFEYRLRKRLKKHTATVYWYRSEDGTVTPSLHTADFWPNGILLGTTTDEFTEPQE